MASKQSKELVKPEGTLHMLPFSEWDKWIEDVIRRPFSLFPQPLMRFSPGWLVTYHALNDLRERGTTLTVWGGGEQQYKYEMGCQSSMLVGIQATRGAASMMSRLLRSSPVQQLDGRFDLQRKVLSRLSVQRTDMDPSQADYDM